jgi:hypothetical protein
LLPYATAPLRSSAQYPDDLCEDADLEDRFERKRERDEENLESEYMEGEDARSDAEEPLQMRKDTPQSPSWQKRYMNSMFHGV